MGEHDHRVTKFLSAIPWLRQFSMANIIKVARAISLQRFAAGSVIVQKGDAGAGYYFIWEGRAVVSSTADSDESVLNPGDYFGTTGVDLENIFEATITAQEEVTCLVLQHKDIGLLFPETVWKQDITVERILQLQKIKDDSWHGNNLAGAPVGVLYGPKGQILRVSMFGGQFVSQALAAAIKSVDSTLTVHSLHSYFLYGGDASLPVIYNVERVRDSQSFATRSVTAVQRGRSVFTLTASFQRAEESITYQDPMPNVPDPSQFRSEEQIILSRLGDPRIPMFIRNIMVADPLKSHPLDLRLCDPNSFINPKNLKPSQNLWIRCKHKLPDDQALHRCVVAYASDLVFLQTILRPHEEDSRTKYHLLSLDHSMWFHKDVKADEWLLFQITSPRASGSRGLVVGHMYTQSGELVVTAVQQGLARPRGNTSKL